jgi:predicted MFS family arabinose efflux permease
MNRLPAFSLMLGNLIVGLCVLAPAGMLNHLSAGLEVSVLETGLLITYGAAVLCFGSPLVSWLTSRLDRRTLMGGAMAILALTNFASAFAPNYTILLILRVVMLIAAAPFTPQAASTISLIVGENERPRAIAFVFLGWSLSIAVGLPLIGFLAAELGWRASYAVLAAAGAATAVLLFIGLPQALYGTAVSLQSWGAIARNRRILVMLLTTALAVAGPFATFTYLAPILLNLVDADTALIGVFFAIFGFAGLVGNTIATRIVGNLGPYATSFLFLGSAIVGAGLWSVGAGYLAVMLVASFVWGLGFAAINSMQQARLIAAGPALAAGSVSLNTSAIYVGQAVGSGIGGALIQAKLVLAFGPLALAFLVLAALSLALTRGPGEALWRPAARSA